MFDQKLVHALVGGKDLDCGLAELSGYLVGSRGHGSLLLDLEYFRTAAHPDVIHVIRHAEPRGDQVLAFYTRPAGGESALVASPPSASGPCRRGSEARTSLSGWSKVGVEADR